jgi:hypothetical protein
MRVGLTEEYRGGYCESMLKLVKEYAKEIEDRWKMA